MSASKLTSINSYFKKQMMVLAAAIVLGVFCSTTSVFAVTENTDNIPQKFQDIIYGASGYGQVRGGRTGDNKCANYNTGSFNWLSIAGNNSIDTVTVPQGTPGVNAWINTFGLYCDSVITNGTGQISEKTLKRTRSNITDLTAKFKPSIGGSDPVVNKNQLVGTDKALTLNSSQAQYFNNRYIKGYSTGDNTDYPANAPVHRDFTISGLSSLAPRSQPYEVEVEVTILSVNEFSNGSRSWYYCVANGFQPGVGYTDAGDLNGSSGRCATQKIPLILKIKVDPQYDGLCFIKSVKGIQVPVANGTKIYMNPNETFKAEFLVGNAGTATWQLTGANAVKLGTVGDVRTWGPQRVTIIGNRANGTEQVSGPGLAGFGPVFEAEFKVDKDVASGPQRFEWRLLREGLDDQIGTTTCSVDIYIKENKPFIHVKGGDVVSGANFTNGPTCEAAPTEAAVNASIQTNGHYLPSGSLVGTSMSQYAVFASGAIGAAAVDNGSMNNFLGNYGFNNRYSSELKDALFANTNGSYGYYYGDDTTNTPSLPCVNTSSLTVGEQALPTGSSAAQAFLVDAAQNGVRTSAASVNIGDIELPDKARKTLKVNGDVTISGPIKSKNTSFSSIADVPVLTIIANNIYIQAWGPNLDQQIDASLIAVPSTSSNGQQQGGVVDTCSTMFWKYSDGRADTNSAGSWPTDGQMSTGSCNRSPNASRTTPSLVINGSVMARRVLLKRTSGTLGVPESAADTSCAASVFEFPNPAVKGVARLENCSAELFSYSSIFQPGRSQSILPKSTIELPPIY